MKQAHAQLLAALLLTIVLGFVVVLTLKGRPSVPPQTQPPATNAPSHPVSSGGCVVGGCSSQLCTDASQGPVVSDCLYKAEYACYRQAKCERQSDGQCGWTPTPALTACLASPPPIQ